ncbi:HD domain-containing protein [Nanoarchaeota archaeon]
MGGIIKKYSADSLDSSMIPEILLEIIDGINKHKGKCYLIGGALLDLMEGKEAKDYDIEVYNLSYNKLMDILSDYCNPVLRGKKFCVIKFRRQGIDYDFSIPRLNNDIGLDDDIDMDLIPKIYPKKAAERRDVTINSMYLKLPGMKLSDPYNGLEDLNKGVIKHISDKSLYDPRVVLRIMHILARRGEKVDKDTIEVCKSLVDEYKNIPIQKVFNEWTKLLMKADKPSKGLEFLIDCNWIKNYPELDILRETEQNLDWHPEGNVWNHTMMVVDNAAILRDKIYYTWQLAFMFGALLHDVGKVNATADDLTAYGHDKEGIDIAKKFMNRISRNSKLKKKVISIVRYHMKPSGLYKSKGGIKGWRRLNNNLRLDVAGYFSLADHAGRGGNSLDDKYVPFEKCLELYERFGEGEKKIEDGGIEPLLQGRDFVKMGYKPGTEFGILLKEAYEIQINEKIEDKDLLLNKIDLSSLKIKKK